MIKIVQAILILIIISFSTLFAQTVDKKTIKSVYYCELEGYELIDFIVFLPNDSVLCFTACDNCDIDPTVHINTEKYSPKKTFRVFLKKYVSEYLECVHWSKLNSDGTMTMISSNVKLQFNQTGRKLSVLYTESRDNFTCTYKRL